MQDTALPLASELEPVHLTASGQAPYDLAVRAAAIAAAASVAPLDSERR